VTAAEKCCVANVQRVATDMCLYRTGAFRKLRTPHVRVSFWYLHINLQVSVFTFT